MSSMKYMREGMNNSIKKGVVVAVILLFISVSVIPSTGTNIVEKSSAMSFDGNTLYVGGNGTGNYTRIQDAIDNASSGDTVFVYNGTYYENVIVSKSINLIGENRANTIIDGNHTEEVVHISAHGVNLSGFTIQNSGSEGYNSGMGLHSNNNIITGNTNI